MNLTTLTVADATLQITVGAPLKKSYTILTTTGLTLRDPIGEAVPAAFTVISRWEGLPHDSSKAIKWLLIDFIPSQAGEYTIAVIPQSPDFSISDNETDIQVKNSSLDVRVSKNGVDLLNQFVINGVDQFAPGRKLRIAIPSSDLASSRIVAADGSENDGVGAEAGQNQVRVQDASVFQTGQQVRFEWKSNVDYVTLTDIAFTPGDHYGAWRQSETSPPREIIVARGTPREFIVTQFSVFFGSALYTIPELPLNFLQGDTIEDRFAILEPAKTITGIDLETNTLTLDSNLNYQQMVFAEVIADLRGGQEAAEFTIESVIVEEQNPLRCVIRQSGHFGSSSYPDLSLILRYYFYANQPFVRVRMRLKNATDDITRTVQDAVFQQMYLQLSLAADTTASSDEVLTHSGPASACERIVANQNTSTASAGDFKLAIAEFAENFPSKLVAANKVITYWPFPPLQKGPHTFFADWAKTWDFYLGQNADRGLPMTNTMAAKLDPSYLSSTNAVRHGMAPKQTWTPEDFQGDFTLAEAANRAEKILACAYDLNACAPQDELGSVQRMSLFEFRLSNHLYADSNDQGEMFGWQLFGNVRDGDADGYTFNRYDVPFLLLREFLRGGDQAAFRLGNEHARYMADAGTVQSDIAYNGNQSYNLKGLNRYERSPDLTFGVLSPRPTHSWSEGLWLYWAMTGDPIVLETAKLHRDCARRWKYQGVGWNPEVTVDASLAFNEARGPGWAALELLAAWKYGGEEADLNLCKQYLDNLRLSEESLGSRGVYVAPGYEPADSTGTQPFSWAGYPSIALVEYLRERTEAGTRDADLEEFLIRQARWLANGDATEPQLNNRPLVGNISDGTNIAPLGSVFSWYPNGDTTGEVGTNLIAALCSLTLNEAARISGQEFFLQFAGDLFAQTCFYRDLPDGPVQISNRFPINLKSTLFTEDSVKVWAQTAQALIDFLAIFTLRHKIREHQKN